MTTNFKQKAISYLEEIQRKCLVNRFGVDFEKHVKKRLELIDNDFIFDSYVASQPSMIKTEIEELKKQYKSASHSNILLTKYEDIYAYSILEPLYERILLTADKLSLETTTRPFIGTAESKEYNAFAVKVPRTNEYLIVFEGSIFIVANLLAKIIASCLPDFKMTDETVSFNISKERIINHVQTNPELQERFADLVYNAIYLGHSSKTTQYFLREPFGRLQGELLNSLELFVVGHEYGHIYSGHLNESNISKKVIDGKIIERISLNWEMEYEADLIGLTLLLNSLEKENLLPFGFLGPELFFTFLDLDERANNLFREGYETRSFGSDTHPPTIERRKRIRQILKNSLPNNHLESYVDFSEFLENVLEALWDNCKERLVKL